MANLRKLLPVLLVLCLVFQALGTENQPAQPTKLKPIEIEDALQWKSIQSEKVSNNGQWFAYLLAPVKGDSTVVIRQTRSETEYRFPVGETRSCDIFFSENSKWAAFAVFPTKKETREFEKQKKKSYRKAKLVQLSVNRAIEFAKVKSFSFSGENPGWIALHKYEPETPGQEKDKWQGSDLILHELSTDKEFNIGNVSEYAFDKSGRWMAYTIDAQDMSGNGIQLRSMLTGVVASLDSGKFTYEKLNWTEKGDGFCLLRGKQDKDYQDKLYSLLGFKNLSDGLPQKFLFAPEADKSFPENMTISPNRNPQWTEDLQALVFGIHGLEKKKKKEEEGDEKKEEQEKKEGAGGSAKDEPGEKPDLVIWHWKDRRLQSHQQKEESKDKNFSFLCVYWLKGKKFFRLADEQVREVKPMPKGHWAVGYDRVKFQLMANLHGREYSDIYIVDMKTGTRKLALEKCRWHFDPSPNGKKLLFYQGGHFHTLEMGTGKVSNITRALPTSFIDTEEDQNIKDPPIPPIGWSKDSQCVFLYDNWDVWQAAADKSRGKNLTVNGRKQGIRYQRRFKLDPEEKGIDPEQSQYFRIYGEWTKRGGIARIDKGRAGAEILHFDDAYYAELLKAKKANVYLYTRETFKDYPDYYLADPTLKKGQRITQANPQQEDYLWCSGSVLIDYTSEKGDRLQAALFLPANYEKGKSYPTVVYIYEKLSRTKNRYTSPRASGFNKSEYTSRGYAVLMPDIKYKINDPGMSAVWCVLPALEAAIKTDIVDKERVGLQGHSWGGYQTAFLITQTDMFKAAVAGAPLTNMISMYSSIYWNIGVANQQLFESEQGRFSAGYWQDLEAYIRNSPVFHARQVKTPLMILHNDNDGAVDWNQGIEYFNTLRRLEKPVIMLQYRGENHGLKKPANRIDYARRMQEFFDHQLMGKPAPRWLREGVAHLRMDKHLDDYTKPPKKKQEKTIK